MAYTNKVPPLSPSSIIRHDVRGNVLLPNGLRVLGLQTAGFVKTTSDGTFYIDTSGGGGSGIGTVTSVSVVTANGLAGTVATTTTTPAITLSTTVTGILKGNGTSITAAIPGTDYLVSNQTITLSGDVSGTGSTAITTTIGNNVVTFSKIQQIGTATLLGRISAGTGDIEVLTGTQATTLLDIFTSVLKGLTPASGGGTTNFLRADGTWAAPSGMGTVTTVSVVTANGFAGSVANTTSTPAVTLSTTVTGLIKGDGTSLLAAVAGTDYQTPITLTTTGNAGPATFTGSTLNIPVYTTVTNGLVSGGLVTWSGTGFTYDVSAAYYYINGTFYSTNNTQVTLGAADVSNPRLDIVAVNNLGQVVVIPGVPGSNPVKAQIDPTTQIELTTILVPAGATSPINITTAILYDEVVNATWSPSATGVTVDFANATSPYTGSVTASVNATTTGTRYIDFTRSSGTDSVSNYAVLKFAIRLGTAWTSTSTLAIGFYSGTTLISTEISVLNGQYGFNMATTATYQLIQIPIANWRFTQATFTRVRFRFLNSLPAFRLDRVELQAGVVQTVVQVNNIYTTDGSLAGIRTLTLNGNYLDIVGSAAVTTRFNANGSVNIGGMITATTLASGSDKIVVANSTGVLSTATVGSGLSLSGGVLSATGGAAGTVTASPGGTAGYLAKFSSASNIVDSIVSESGSTITVTGSVSVTSTVTSAAFIKTGGTSAQFLKADGSVDTGLYLTSAGFAIDYDNTVTGLRNSSNTVFTTSQNFVSGSTRVFVNGIRQSRGGTYDYTETASNQITFNYAPDNGDLLIIEYIKS